jgi:GNAT superfamily N-acetyltransferase
VPAPTPRDPVRTGPATPDDLLEVFSWLDRDPVVNVYLAALVLRDRLGPAAGEYWLARHGGRLAGLVHLGTLAGAVLPAGDGPPAHAALAALVAERLALLPARFQVAGGRAEVQAIVDRLRIGGLEPRRHRPHTYMAVERGGLPPFERLPGLRRARPEDYALVHDSGADLRAEELGDDPRASDPAGYAHRVEEECREGYTYLWIEDGALRFRASLSALTADAVQIAGVYTPPGQRGRGFAARGLAELCARQFARAPAVCLFVGDGNAPALAVYRRLAFRPLAAWASAFYERAPAGAGLCT